MSKKFEIKSYVCILTFYIIPQKFGRKNILCALYKNTKKMSREKVF
jgi:hypothetical protein